MNHPNLIAATEILSSLGLPKAQINARSALTLLALANVGPANSFADASCPLIGIAPIMTWVLDNYDVRYAPNTRETFRRQTMHQFMAAGLVLYNPDVPSRPVNSPAAVYQLAPETVDLLKSYGSNIWNSRLDAFLSIMGTLADRYARDRNLLRVPVVLESGQTLELSPGGHSELIRDIIMEFAPRFAPGSRLVYAGDTGVKMAFFDRVLLSTLGVQVDNHGKMPDVVLYYESRNWLLLVESVTSHGPMDAKRHQELTALFQSSSAGLVYVTAFPKRSIMAKYLSDIAWETEVWVADSPSHLIHFNGQRFLGPYAAEN